MSLKSERRLEKKAACTEHKTPPTTSRTEGSAACGAIGLRGGARQENIPLTKTDEIESIRAREGTKEKRRERTLIREKESMVNKGLGGSAKRT